MRPAVFGELGYEAALARSRAERKLLIVDATATWCGPCKRDAGLSWPDPRGSLAFEIQLRGRGLAEPIDDALTHEMFRENIQKLLRALRAAGRDAEADELRAEATRIDPASTAE